MEVHVFRQGYYILDCMINKRVTKGEGYSDSYVDSCVYSKVLTAHMFL